MKVARFVLKIVALSLSIAALVCAAIAYWDKLSELGQCCVAKAKAKKAGITAASEYDDYVE